MQKFLVNDENLSAYNTLQGKKYKYNALTHQLSGSSERWIVIFLLFTCYCSMCTENAILISKADSNASSISFKEFWTVVFYVQDDFRLI